MMGEHVVMFEMPYSDQKTKEGLAVHWALKSGACDSCRHLSDCESEASDNWESFPPDAPWRMKTHEKRRIKTVHSRR